MASQIDMDALTGFELMQGLLAGTFPTMGGMPELMDFRFTDVSDGHCTLSGMPQKTHRNGHGVAHGGWALTIMDSAAVCAAVTMLPAYRRAVTATFETKMIKPVRIGRRYQAVAGIISVGRRLAHTHVDLVDVETDQMVAHATCTCAIINLRRDQEEE